MRADAGYPVPVEDAYADPAGVPPAYLEVGRLDIFRDEDLTYAMRLGLGSRVKA